MGKRKPSPQLQWVAPADGKQRKLRRSTPRDKLDATIDWYEKHKPQMPHIMPGGVAMERAELDKFASKQNESAWLYRGWQLRQAEIPPKGAERMRIAK